MTPTLADTLAQLRALLNEIASHLRAAGALWRSYAAVSRRAAPGLFGEAGAKGAELQAKLCDTLAESVEASAKLGD